jgi:hypothetical protein
MRVYAFDFERLEVREIARTDSWLPSLQPDDSTVRSFGNGYLDPRSQALFFYGGDDQYPLNPSRTFSALSRIDLSTGAITELDRLPRSGGSFYQQLKHSGPGTAAFHLLGHQDAAGALGWSLQRAAFPDGHPLELPLNHQLAGRNVTLCQFDLNGFPPMGGAYGCAISGIPGGPIEVAAGPFVIGDRSVDSSVASVRFSTSGAVIRRRLVPGAYLAEMPPLYQGLWTSPDGRAEATLARVDESGRTIQVLLDSTDHVDARFAPATYLRADHHHLAWSPDGAWVYFLTKDPLTGFMQLFRLSTQ